MFHTALNRSWLWDQSNLGVWRYLTVLHLCSNYLLCMFLTSYFGLFYSFFVSTLLDLVHYKSYFIIIVVIIIFLFVCVSRPISCTSDVHIYNVQRTHWRRALHVFPCNVSLCGSSLQWSTIGFHAYAKPGHGSNCSNNWVSI